MSRIAAACFALFLVLACASDEDHGNGADVRAHGVCGDGLCDPKEIGVCPSDCGTAGSGAVCGNGVCETGENATSCPADCMATAMCGNGVCETGENSTNCPQDCGSNTGFDCTSVTNQEDCQFCFEDDADFGLGACDEFGDVTNGTADDCAMCAANGSFGPPCEAECAGGESDACAACETQ